MLPTCVNTGKMPVPPQTSHFTSPPTIVCVARPFSFHPPNGQLRLRLLNSSRSTVHSRLGSMIVTSPSAQSASVPLFNAAMRAGLMVISSIIFIAVHSFVVGGIVRVLVDAERSAPPSGPRERFRRFTVDRWVEGGRETWWPIFWIYNIAYGVAALIICVPMMLIALAILAVFLKEAPPAVATGGGGRRLGRRRAAGRRPAPPAAWARPAREQKERRKGKKREKLRRRTNK